jgi:hypothetical protein
MTTAMTTIKKWQDDYLTMLARVEEPVVTYTGKAMEAIADYVPERPQWAFLNQLPTLTEVVDSQLKFRRQVIDEQAALVRKLMKAIDPALTRVGPKVPAAKRASKPSPVRKVGVKAA